MKGTQCPEEGLDGEEEDPEDYELGVGKLLCKDVFISFLPSHSGTAARVILFQPPGRGERMIQWGPGGGNPVSILPVDIPQPSIVWST